MEKKNKTPPTVLCCTEPYRSYPVDARNKNMMDRTYPEDYNGVGCMKPIFIGSG